MTRVTTLIQGQGMEEHPMELPQGNSLLVTRILLKQLSITTRKPEVTVLMFSEAIHGKAITTSGLLPGTGIL